MSQAPIVINGGFKNSLHSITPWIEKHKVNMVSKLIFSRVKMKGI